MKSLTVHRDSNIELLRIVAMMGIILHHYCLNSGIQNYIDVQNLTINAVILQLLSVGGKMGINVFFLISGYFMVDSIFKLEHVVKLFAEVIFYTLFICVFLHIIGYRYSMKEYLLMIPCIFNVNDFVPCYLLLYLSSPFLNRFVDNITKKEFSYVLGILLFYFVIEQSVFLQFTWNYFGWATTVYLLGAYIKKNEIDKKNYPFFLFLIISFCLLWGGILLFDALKIDNSHINWYYFIVDSNKITMIVPAVCFFLFFKKLNIKYNPFINKMAACSFGVFLFHTTNDTLRQFLWNDVFHVKDQFHSNWLILHALFAVLIVYLVGSVIDMLRKKYFEKIMIIKTMNFIGKERKNGCL